MLRQSHYLWFNYRNNVWEGVQAEGLHFEVPASLLLLPRLAAAVLSTLLSNTGYAVLSIWKAQFHYQTQCRCSVTNSYIYLQNVTDSSRRQKWANINFSYLQLPDKCHEFARLKNLLNTQLQRPASYSKTPRRESQLSNPSLWLDFSVFLSISSQLLGKYLAIHHVVSVYNSHSYCHIKPDNPRRRETSLR
jgi:hypothetical protein